MNDLDHDHHRDSGYEADEPIESNPIWQQDNVTLRSVGIDIGSAGTQIAFSRLQLRRMGERLTSRYVVVRRETLFESEIFLTPYLDERRIDAASLGEMLDKAYQDAGQEPVQIDTGVVILTGEALRRRNAERIAAVVSEQAGDLVCATAGHHMESMLAAYGSGAALISHERAERILNVDIGGGTTKLAVVESGRVVATAALHVGGRLQVMDDEGRIERLDPAGRDHAAACGFAWSLGDHVKDSDLELVADAMTEAILVAIKGAPLPERARELYLTEPIADFGRLDGVVFSGGVAEYVYGREHRDFGDLGRHLGDALRARIGAGKLPAPLLAGAERIRATVLGASEYTVQLSGNTSYISSPDTLLPRRNVQVVRPDYELAETVDQELVAAAVYRHLVSFDLASSETDVAVALTWRGEPSYPRLHAFASGIVQGLDRRLDRQLPLYLMVDADIALTLGSLLRDELHVGSDLLVLDGLNLFDFDFVDLGRLRQPSNTVPVTIKSLMFSAGGPVADPT
jgi:ethanolamine utilization protein EutA